MPLQICLDRDKKDEHATTQNIHRSNVKTRNGEKIDLFTNAKLWIRAAPQEPLEESSLPGFIERDLDGGCPRLAATGLHFVFKSISNLFFLSFARMVLLNPYI